MVHGKENLSGHFSRSDARQGRYKILDNTNAQELPEEIPAPKTEPTLAASRAIAIFVVFLIVQIVVGVFLGIVVMAFFTATQGIADTSAIKDVMAPFTLPIGIMGVAVAGIIAFIMARLSLRGRINEGAFESLGWRPSKVSTIALAALTGGVLSLIYIFGLVPSSPPEVGQQFGLLATAAAKGGLSRHIWAVAALALAPPVEEFVFRGILFSGLSRALGIRASAAIVTGIFILMHATETLGYWPAWAGISLIACATIMFRIKTGSLLPCIAAHAGYNLALVGLSYFGSVLR